MSRLKVIPNYENYVCNTWGVIYNRKTHKVLRQCENSKGYKCVVLTNEEGQKSFLVHRLVAMLFVANPNPEKYDEVNHKNNIKTDNRARNLEWCDESYNRAYQIAMQRVRKDKGII